MAVEADGVSFANLINKIKLQSEKEHFKLSPCQIQDNFNKPSMSKECCTDLENPEESDLEAEQEQFPVELVEIIDNSECVLEKNGNNNTNDSLLKKCEPSKWKKNIYKRQKVEAKAAKPINCTKCRFRCTDKLAEDARNVICRNYWATDFIRRKDFILSTVESHVPERRRSTPGSLKKPRQDSKRYFLEHDSIRIRVCMNFFVKTLCISKEVIEHAFNFIGEGGLFASNDQRGKGQPHNKTKDSDIEVVNNHIKSFSAMESHYCKLSIAQMHNLYKEFCKNENLKPVSQITYRRTFCKNYNL